MAKDKSEEKVSTSTKTKSEKQKKEKEKTARKRAEAPRRTAKKKAEKGSDKDLSESYNNFKEFEGKKYTGMKVGRSHKWYYDQGEWKEKKLTPDEWEITFKVPKRRAGKAPEGSGVPVGTEYHWYILAHQHVTKLDANTYSTAMTGRKIKLAHKRAEKDKWNITDKTQKKRLIKALESMIEDLKDGEE